MTSNDVVQNDRNPQAAIYPAGNLDNLDPRLAEEGGSSLKVSSSFHPVQHEQYKLWLNDEKNVEFFKRTPRYLKKMQEDQRIKAMNGMRINRKTKVKRVQR